MDLPRRLALALPLVLALALPTPAAARRTAAPAALQMHLARGSVRLRGSRGASTQVSEHVVEGGEGCRLRRHTAADGLHLEGPADGRCVVDVDVLLPQHLDVTVVVGEGRVTASGLRGSLEVHIDRGGAVLGGRLPRLRVALAQGSLSATGAFGAVDLQLGRGNAQLWYEAPPRDGTVNVDVAAGNVVIGVPDTVVTCRARLQQGSLRNGADGGGGAGSLLVDGQLGRGDLVVRAGR